MLEQIFTGIYKLEIPLPESPLRSVNSYIIKSEDRNLIIDTGMNRPECKQVVENGMKELNIDLDKTDVFITHLHADHSGLLYHLCSANSIVYGSSVDIGVIKDLVNCQDGLYWKEYCDYAIANGFANARAVAYNHPAIQYMDFQDDSTITFSFVADGDKINVGDYTFICLATPGHSPGHLCLYEPSQKLLFSGDHILAEISPNIELFSNECNPLKDYINSLNMLRDLDVNLVLPAHRSPILEHQVRIDELIEHHKKRCEEIIDILHKTPERQSSAYQIASLMHWDLKCKNFCNFPLLQKWFATGESIAHLQYLYELGKVTRHYNIGSIKYSLQVN